VVELVIASTFHHFMEKGRTSPAIFSCSGTQGEGEFVVKLRGGMEFGTGALLCELYASMLGAYFGMSCPRPAVVLIEENLAEAVAKHLIGDERGRQIMRNSIGLNFGSQFLTDLSPWPVDKQIPANLEEAAFNVFAFDALIQNPDRTFKNPNLGTRGDDLFIFDHECAFSFLVNPLPSDRPWLLHSETYLEKHVFAKLLRRLPFPPDFIQSLADLSGEVIERFSEQVPAAWRSSHLGKIESHLKLMQEHSAEFANEITRRFA